MASIKTVKLLISSCIKNLEPRDPDGKESEITRVSTYGALVSNKDGSFILSYKENSEGGEIICDMRILKDEVIIIRRGAIESTIHFREGERHSSLYSIPPYSFDLEVLTKRITNTLTSSDGSLDLVYKMTLGGAVRGCRMKISIKQ